MIAEDYVVDNVYDECEVHHNCTVEIWTNTKTGAVSIGWYENEELKGEQSGSTCADSR